MKIILEGCDGTGKTTLAKLLSYKYGLDICHCTQTDPADYDFYRQTARKENVIWDRHTIGELIYPEVFGRKPKIGVEDARLALHYAKEAGAKIFVLTADINEIRRRLMSRGKEDQRVLDKLEWINNQFLFYADIYNIPVIDTSTMTFNDIFNLVEEKPFIDKEEPII